MTFKDLKLMMERDAREQTKLHRQTHTSLNEVQEALTRKLANRNFFCGNVIEQNPRRPCYNHLIGLPSKNDIIHPIYDYQLEIIDYFEKGGKYLAVKKARGLGFSELILRYLTYLVVCRNEQYRGSRFCIVSGPRENLATELIRRARVMLLNLGVPIIEETERTILRFLGTDIEAFPSSRVDTMRSYTDVKFVFIDEAAFFTSSTEGDSVRAVAEGYIAKTDTAICMVSTPSVPGTMFENVMDEPETTCLYKRLKLPYSIGLGKIFTQEEINKAMASPNFEREYNLAFSYGLGNCFLEQNIKKCIQSYEQPSATMLGNTVINVGVDIGFASSKLAYVVSAVLPDGENVEKVYVLEASEFEKVSFEMSVQLIANVLRKYNHNPNERRVITLVDGSRPEWVSSLKSEMFEDPNYHPLLEYAKKYRINLDQLMSIIPIQFGSAIGQQLLTHFQSLVSDGNLVIAPRFQDLLLQMRQARVRPTNQMLDKSSNSLDLVDAASLSLWNVDVRL